MNTNSEYKVWKRYMQLWTSILRSKRESYDGWTFFGNLHARQNVSGASPALTLIPKIFDLDVDQQVAWQANLQVFYLRCLD